MVVVFPLPRVSSLDKMERGPHIGKIIKKKRDAAIETCGRWDHVSLLFLHWILLSVP